MDQDVSFRIATAPRLTQQWSTCWHNILAAAPRRIKSFEFAQRCGKKKCSIPRPLPCPVLSSYNETSPTGLETPAGKAETAFFSYGYDSYAMFCSSSFSTFVSLSLFPSLILSLFFFHLSLSWDLMARSLFYHLSWCTNRQSSSRKIAQTRQCRQRLYKHCQQTGPAANRLRFCASFILLSERVPTFFPKPDITRLYSI